MRVRAPDGRCFPVQKEAHRALLAGAFRMKVHQDDSFADFRHVSVRNGEGVVSVVVMCKTTQKVHNADIAVLGRKDRDAAARTLRGVVHRAQNALLRFQIRLQFGPDPCMVAQRDDVRPGTEDLLRLLRGDADDICILAVDDGKRNVICFLEVLQMVFKKLHPGYAADIPDCKNVDQHNGPPQSNVY